MPRRATAILNEPLDTPAPPLPGPLASLRPDPTTTAPERTLERQRLAHAIETVRRLEVEITAAGAAIDPAREATWAAQRALDEAEDVLRGARPRDTYAPPPAFSVWGSQAEADEAARRARIAAEAPPMSVADAKAAVEAAKDALDTSKRTRQGHEDKLRTAQQRLQTNQSTIRDAVRAVLRADPAVLTLAMECRRLKTRAAASEQAFRGILWGDTVQPGSPFYGWDSAASAHSSPEAMADWSAARDWGSAIEALASDPDAPLPMP